MGWSVALMGALEGGTDASGPHQGIQPRERHDASLASPEGPIPLN